MKYKNIIFDFGGPRAASAPDMRAGQPFILKWQKKNGDFFVCCIIENFLLILLQSFALMK